MEKIEFKIGDFVKVKDKKIHFHQMRYIKFLEKPRKISNIDRKFNNLVFFQFVEDEKKLWFRLDHFDKVRARLRIG